MLFVFGLGPSLKVGGNFVWKHGGEPVSWLPYRLLLAIPGLGALRAPVRVEYVLVALLVAATAIALHRAVDAAPARAWIVGVGCGGAARDEPARPAADRRRSARPPASEHALREIARLARPGDTVLSVPADCDPAFVSLQVFHHAPVVGCAGSFAANPWSKLARTRVPQRSPSCAATADLRPALTTPTHAPSRSAPTTSPRCASEFGVRFVVIDHASSVRRAGVEAALSGPRASTARSAATRATR